MPDQTALHKADHHRPQRRPRRSRGSNSSATPGRTACSLPVMQWTQQIAKPLSLPPFPPRPRQRAGQFSCRYISRQPGPHHTRTVRQAYGDQRARPVLHDARRRAPPAGNRQAGLHGQHSVNLGTCRAKLPVGLFDIERWAGDADQEYGQRLSDQPDPLQWRCTRLDGHARRACGAEDFPRRARRLASYGRGRAADGPAGQARQIAPLIAYLLSPDSGIITGAIIDYDQQIIGAVPE